jgi:hypothetical protein
MEGYRDMSWLDTLFNGITTVQVAGLQLPQQRIVNFTGGVTGADDPLNYRTVLTVGSAFGGGGVPVSGALGTLSANSFYTVRLDTQDSTATLPTMTADGFVVIAFLSKGVAVPHKATISSTGANIDNSETPYLGLQAQAQYSTTGVAVFYWNNSLGEWSV